MLERLFSPRSIAVIGASRTPGKLGHDVLVNIKKYGYAGKIYPINPSAQSIADLDCYTSIKNVRGNIDVAVIMIPAVAVPEVLKECGEKKVPFAVIISAGFKELGGDGKKREEEIKRIAEQYSIRVVGPNCLGYMNVHKRLNASFATGMPAKGNISFVSQSGAMGVAMLDWAYQSKLGFANMISIGNKADVDEVDCLDYFANDRRTSVIMMYLESIEDGRAFMRAAARVSYKKPIIVLKAGSSEQAKKAVSSHTGSLAGSEEAMKAGFEHAGVIHVKTVQEFFDFGLALSLQPLPQSDRVAIITNAGGPGIMAVDSAAGTQVQLPQLSSRVQKQLAKGLPEAANTKNPIDVVGDAPPERYDHALKQVIGSKEVDAGVVILTPQVMTDEDATARLVAKAQKRYQKPILTSFMGGLDIHSGRVILEVNGIPNYDTPERAVRAMDQLIQQSHRSARARWKSQKTATEASKSQTKKLPNFGHHVQIRTREAEQILKSYSVPLVESQFIRTIEDCAAIQSFPVVMKIASRDVIHKSAIGAVELNIGNVAEAKQAFKRIQRNVLKKMPQAEIEGMLVQKQLESHSRKSNEGKDIRTQEVIIGMKRDPSFGPVMMFGLGGTLVELFKDVSFGIAPLSVADAKQMIQHIRTAPLLAENDLDVVARVLVDVSELSLAYVEITELDINPMIVHPRGHGGVVVDVRMMTHE